MTSFRERSRFATLVAIGLALLVSGAVTAAAGGNFILGQANSAGTSNTSLTTASTGTALLVTQNGTGTAIRGSTGSGSGIAGFFTSGSGSGVSGVVANENSYGVYAANDSATEGSGAALRVSGQQNEGVVATSADTNAVRAVVSGCDGFLCGGNGVSAKGAGFAAGVFGDGTGSIAGVWASEGALASVYATSATAFVSALYADATANTGAYIFGQGSATSIDDCGSFFCAGAVISGENGVLAGASLDNGVAVYGFDESTGGTGWGLGSSGDAFITGNLSITGTCTGCVLAATAVNGSNAVLNQGDAVALDGVRTAPDGSIVVVVRAAKKGDQVLGLVDRALTLSSETVKVPAGERNVRDNAKGERTIKTPARELKAQGRKWLAGGTKVSADAYLRVVTSGMLTMEAGLAGAAAGDSLAVADTAGKLSKAGGTAERGTVAGKFLGKLKDGRTVLLVDPS